MGIKVSPEAVEGLTVGYAIGEFDEASGTLGLVSLNYVCNICLWFFHSWLPRF